MNSKRLSILAAFLLTLLVSCASNQNLINKTVQNMTVLSTYPAWWEEKEAPNGNRTFFYEKERGQTAYLATLEAYYNVLGEIATLRGDDTIQTRYISELISTNKVDAFSLKVEALNLYQYSNSEIECIVKASCSTDAIYSENVSREEVESDLKRADALFNEGRSLYRQNDDINALDKFIDAALILQKYPRFEYECRTVEIRERILRILKNAYIDIRGQNYTNGSCRLTLKRAYGIIHPNIKQGEIEAYIPSIIGDENVISYTTGPGGVLNFAVMTYDVSKSGTIRFRVKFPEKLLLLTSDEGKKLIEEAKDAIETNEVALTYSSKKLEGELTLDASILFLDTNDDEILLPSLLEEFSTSLSNNEIAVSYLNDEKYKEKDIDRVVNAYFSEPSHSRRYFLAVVGHTDDITPLSNDRAMHVLFDARLYDTVANTLLYESEGLDAVDTASSEAELYNNTFKKGLGYIQKIVEWELSK